MRVFILFLIVFDLAIPPLKFLGSAFVAIFLMLPELRRRICINKFIFNLSILRYPIFILVMVLFFSIISTIFSSTNEMVFVFSICKSVVIFLACILYVSIFEINNLKYDLVNIFFINSVVCFIAGSNDFLLNLVYTFKPDDALMSWIPYRNSFLAGSGFFGISTAYGLVFFLIAYILKTSKQPLYFYLKIIVIILAGVIAGRIAMLGLVFGCFLFLSDFKKLLIFSIFLIVSIYIFLSIDTLSAYSGWLFEFMNNDGASTESTDILMSMYETPMSSSQFLFGDGLYDNYYMGVDAGYLRHLYFGGIVLVLLAIAYPFTFALSNKNLLFLFFIVPICLIFHLKGAFIFHSRIGMPVLFMLSVIFRSNKVVRS